MISIEAYLKKMGFLTPAWYISLMTSWRRIPAEDIPMPWEMDSTGPTIAHRLGEKRKDQPRPLEIVMESKNHKAWFMSKLWKLKHADNAYKKIRVTDDHTWEERQEIRRWVKMANDRNAGNSDDDEEPTTKFAWKVRGSPTNNNLRLIRMKA